MGYAEEETVTFQSLLLDSVQCSLAPGCEVLPGRVPALIVVACQSMQRMPSHLQKNITKHVHADQTSKKNFTIILATSLLCKIHTSHLVRHA